MVTNCLIVWLNYHKKWNNVYKWVSNILITQSISLLMQSSYQLILLPPIPLVNFIDCCFPSPSIVFSILFLQMLNGSGWLYWTIHVCKVWSLIQITGLTLRSQFLVFLQTVGWTWNLYLWFQIICQILHTWRMQGGW